jgi:GNAT superfamily N-acetyltransferase
MPTLGAQIVPARISELRRVLLDLSPHDLSQLDPTLGVMMEKPLGRELLAARLPVADSVYICLFNLEPSGLIVLHRSRVAVQIRALAVSPDQRRKGLARTLLEDADRRVPERGLKWLWMHIPSANVPATRCALACGFRRYRPQFLCRSVGRSIPAAGYHIQLEHLEGEEAGNSSVHWAGVELACGDAWAQPLVEMELMPVVLPRVGQVWRCHIDGTERGCIHMGGSRTHPIIMLWLDQPVWDTPEELGCVRAALNTLVDAPPAMDIWLGSEGHLRKSVARYKALDFVPKLDERVIFARKLEKPRPPRLS